MEFQCNFITNESNSDTEGVLKCEICNIGFIVIDEIREKFNIPEFPISSISNATACTINRSLKIIITEEEARESGHFLERLCIDVRVPNLFLTPYQDLEFEELYKFQDLIISDKLYFPKFWRRKVINMVIVRNKVIYDDIIVDWKKAGYPLYWDCQPIKEVKE